MNYKNSEYVMKDNNLYPLLSSNNKLLNLKKNGLIQLKEKS